MKYRLFFAENAMFRPILKAMTDFNDMNIADKIKNLLETIQTIANNPESFPYTNDDYLPENKYRKAAAGKDFIIYYQIRGNNVYIDCILYCSKDYAWLIKNEER